MSDTHRYPVVPITGPTAVELTVEQRYDTLLSVYKLQLFSMWRFMGRQVGWDVANDMVDEMAAAAVPTIVRGYQRKFGLPGSGAALVSQVLSAEFQTEGCDVATISETDDAAEYTVDCTFGAALQSGRFDDVDITDGLCHRGCWKWTERVAQTVDPGFAVERTHWMGTPPVGRDSGSAHDGCERCRFIISRRG